MPAKKAAPKKRAPSEKPAPVAPAAPAPPPIDPDTAVKLPSKALGDHHGRRFGENE